MAAEAGALALARRSARSGTVVARLTAKKAVRSGVGWGYFFGICVASSAYTYTTTYKTVAEREKLVANFGSNTALAALFGPAHQLQTVAGFTAYKVLAFLGIVGGIWGLLASTRLLRGEEDAGRWELLRTGQTTARGATAQALAGLGAGLAVLFAMTAVITAATGRLAKVDFSISQSLFLALTLVCSAAVFLAAGALTSQLAPTRRKAAGYAAYAFGACYALRMLAGSGIGLEWLRWATPLGWMELMRPLTGSDWAPLVPMTGLVIALSVAAVEVAGARDLGASTFPDRSEAPMRPRLLNGPLGLTARLGRPAAVAWAAVLAVVSFIFGLVAKPAGAALSGSNSINRVLSHLGAKGFGAGAYLGIVFLMVAVMLTFVAAGHVTAARSEEAEGRLDHLLAQPVTRRAWLGDRLAFATGALVADGLLVGISCWLGSASNRAGVAFGSLIGAGLNIVPPAVFVLGTGALVMGAWPRATSAAVHAVIVWSAAVTLISGFSGGNRWLLDTSLFHQMASAPAVAPDWVSGGVIAAIGVAAAVAGSLAFRRRDTVGQ